MWPDGYGAIRSPGVVGRAEELCELLAVCHDEHEYSRTLGSLLVMHERARSRLVTSSPAAHDYVQMMLEEKTLKSHVDSAWDLLMETRFGEITGDPPPPPVSIRDEVKRRHGL